jgi:hypothetical protein
MSERTIRRSVWGALAVLAGLSDYSHRNVEGATRGMDAPVKTRIRNNYTQKATARVRRVARWRRANKTARLSRKLSRQRG